MLPVDPLEDVQSYGKPFDLNALNRDTSLFDIQATYYDEKEEYFYPIDREYFFAFLPSQSIVRSDPKVFVELLARYCIFIYLFVCGLMAAMMFLLPHWEIPVAGFVFATFFGVLSVLGFRQPDVGVFFIPACLLAARLLFYPSEAAFLSMYAILFPITGFLLGFLWAPILWLVRKTSSLFGNTR